MSAEFVTLALIGVVLGIGLGAAVAALALGGGDRRKAAGIDREVAAQAWRALIAARVAIEECVREDAAKDTRKQILVAETAVCEALFGVPISAPKDLL